MSDAATPIEEVDRLLRRLRLPYIRRSAAEVMATAKAQRWDPAEALRVLLEEEAAGRDRSMMAKRLAKAGFPQGKTFETWDEKASSIPEPTQRALRSVEWVERKESLCMCGPSGTGKSHFLEAIGRQLIAQGRTVAWTTLEAVGELVRRHRIDDTVNRAVARLSRHDLVVVDDIGLLPVRQEAAEGLYRIVDAVYEKRSIAVSSNLHPSGFDQIMPKALATPTVDRLLHHAHVVVTEGESFRLSEAMAGKGVMPLT